MTTKDFKPEQIETIKAWAAAGAQLPEIQKKLEEEFGMSATYLDTRFLVLDLKIELVSEEEPEEPAADEASPADPSALAPGGVQVALDSITRPGAMVSGTIVFSDGETAAWLIDQTGRPGLETKTEGYEPTEADLIEFEKQLRDLMAQGGPK